MEKNLNCQMNNDYTAKNIVEKDCLLVYNKNMKIKYDTNTIKILKAVMIISALFTLVGWFCILNEIDGTEYVMVGGIIGGGLLLLYSGIQLLAGLCYIHRLKYYGYEVPYRKKDYGNDLHNVPRNDEGIHRSGRNAESKILCFINLIIFAGSNLWNVYYFLHKYMDTHGVSLLWVPIVADMYWLMAAIVAYRQRNSEKYRDDVEVDPHRKERVSIERGVMNSVVIFIFILHCKSAFFTLMDIIHRARM